jgi:hypothetical protein
VDDVETKLTLELAPTASGNDHHITYSNISFAEDIERYSCTITAKNSEMKIIDFLALFILPKVSRD